MAILTSSPEHRQIAAHQGQWRRALLGKFAGGTAESDAQIVAHEGIFRAELLARIGAGAVTPPTGGPLTADNIYITVDRDNLTADNNELSITVDSMAFFADGTSTTSDLN